jgi:hypothetical protein
MGTDINTFVQLRKKNTQEWENLKTPIFVYGFAEESSIIKMDDSPWYWRSYGLFEFLTAGEFGTERTKSNVPTPIKGAYRGWPEDEATKELNKVQDWFYGGDYYRYDKWTQDYGLHHYVLLSEFNYFDWDQTFFDMRSKETTTVREFLEENFFEHLYVMRSLVGWGSPFDEVRILMCFD